MSRRHKVLTRRQAVSNSNPRSFITIGALGEKNDGLLTMGDRSQRALSEVMTPLTIDD